MESNFCMIPCRKTLQQNNSGNDRQTQSLIGAGIKKKRSMELNTFSESQCVFFSPVLHWLRLLQCDLSLTHWMRRCKLLLSIRSCCNSCFSFCNKFLTFETVCRLSLSEGRRFSCGCRTRVAWRCKYRPRFRYRLDFVQIHLLECTSLDLNRFTFRLKNKLMRIEIR